MTETYMPTPFFNELQALVKNITEDQMQEHEAFILIGISTMESKEVEGGTETKNSVINFNYGRSDLLNNAIMKIFEENPDSLEILEKAVQDYQTPRENESRADFIERMMSHRTRHNPILKALLRGTVEALREHENQVNNKKAKHEDQAKV